MNWWRKKKRKKWKGRFARFLHDLSGESVAPSKQASYTARENVSLVNGRSTRHVARAIGSEKHLWKRASPFTSEATDYLIPSGRAQGEKMTVCEWPRSLPPALSLSLSLSLQKNADRWSRLSSSPVTTETFIQNFPFSKFFCSIFSKSIFHNKEGTSLFFFSFFFFVFYSMVGIILSMIPIILPLFQY